MIAAIYARKSTEQHGVSDEEKSVTRQIEHGKAYAAKKGWTVLDQHIYADDGISGAEFKKRPGLARLLNALTPRPPFQVLIMMEESRLGREQIETAYVLKRITDAGVRVFFYANDQERRLDSALDKVMLSLVNFAAEMEREKASQRTHEAMLRKAKSGHVLGGKVFGYDNVEVWGEPGLDGKPVRKYVQRRINPTEAAIVRRIFEQYASGVGLTRLAKELNAEQVPPPRGGRRGWAPSAIREMLRRDLYRGIVLWNRTQTVQRGGTKRQRHRSLADWLQAPVPGLQIVPDDLWDAVQKQPKRAEAGYHRMKDGRLRSHPTGEAMPSPYLLSGLARCGVCGGSLVGITRPKACYVRHAYGCSYYHKRGSSICSNGFQIRREILDQALLQAVSEALDEDVLQAAVQQALEQLQAEQSSWPDRRLALTRELSVLESRLHNLAEAIAHGQGSETLLTALQRDETRRQALLRELQDLHAVSGLDEHATKSLVGDLRTRVQDVKGLLSRHLPQARQVLQALLLDKIRCEPVEEDGRLGYRFSAVASYGGLLAAGTVCNHGGGGQGF